MALELETELMREIGLGNHFHWFNGSGSCAGIRIHAAAKLSDAIQAAHDRGEKIAPPVKGLCDLAQKISVVEIGQYTLTDTWQACAEVIRAHIDKAYGTRNACSRTREYLERKHKKRLGFHRDYTPETYNYFGVSVPGR